MCSVSQKQSDRREGSRPALPWQPVAPWGQGSPHSLSLEVSEWRSRGTGFLTKCLLSKLEQAFVSVSDQLHCHFPTEQIYL